MKTLFLALTIGGLIVAPAQAQTVIFHDEFDGTALDASKWNLGTWTLGRTHLGNSPVVADGIARLTFDTYGFKGTEIWSKSLFSLGSGLEIEARVRLNNLPSGLVTSLFTYNTSGRLSDEIDIEILSKQVNLSSGGDPILLTTWNDWSEARPTYDDGVHHWNIWQIIPGLDVNEWHDYTIRWLPGRTEWLLDGILVASSDKAQPNLSTYVRLNFWAPASSWTDAYDARLKPARRARDNVRHYYDVDWIEVRQLP
jgi:beta-glucanase (GH16 family)